MTVRWALVILLLVSGGLGEAASGSGPAIEVTGAQVATYDGRTRQYVFRGPRVVVTRGEHRLEAPEVLYDAGSGRVVLPRRGRVSTPTAELEADRLEADLRARHLVGAGDVVGRFLDGETWVELRASSVEADDRIGHRRAEARGDVRIHRGQEELRGEIVSYDLEARRALVEGGAVLMRGQDRLQADRIMADLASRRAEAAGHVALDRPEEALHATSEDALYEEATDTAVLWGHVTVRRGDDVLRSDRVTAAFREHLVISDGHVQLTARPQEARP